MTASPIVIPAGATQANIVVDVVDDLKLEGNETAVLVLTNPQNATLGAQPAYTVRIRDDDGPQMSPNRPVLITKPVEIVPKWLDFGLLRVGETSCCSECRRHERHGRPGYDHEGQNRGRRDARLRVHGPTGFPVRSVGRPDRNLRRDVHPDRTRTARERPLLAAAPVAAGAHRTATDRHGDRPARIGDPDQCGRPRTTALDRRQRQR